MPDIESLRLLLEGVLVLLRVVSGPQPRNGGRLALEFVALKLLAAHNLLALYAVRHRTEQVGGLDFLDQLVTEVAYVGLVHLGVHLIRLEAEEAVADVEVD